MIFEDECYGRTKDELTDRTEQCLFLLYIQIFNLCMKPFINRFQISILIFISGSCPEFGVSGSGIVREWKKRLSDIGEEITGPAIDDIDKKELQYQYSFVGPLSMSKGCDLTADFSGNRKLEESQSQSRQNSLENRIPEFVYRGKS